MRILGMNGIGIYFWLSGGSDGGSMFGELGNSIPQPPAFA